MTRQLTVDEAVQDMEFRSLQHLAGGFARLVYLASTRDLNTGQYFHEGLTSRYSETVAAKALAQCHRQVFRGMVESSLEDLVRELDRYVRSNPAGPEVVLNAWGTLEPFYVVPPAGCESLARALFVSNVRIAVAILRAHQNPPWEGPPGA